MKGPTDIEYYGSVTVLAAIAVLVLFNGSLFAGIGILAFSIWAFFDFSITTISHHHPFGNNAGHTNQATTTA